MNNTSRRGKRIQSKAIRQRCSRCANRAKAHGYCEMHYQRLRRNVWIDGEPEDVLDSEWYKVGVKLVDEYVRSNNGAKFSELANTFEDYKRVIDSICNTLELELRTVRVQRHVEFIEPMPEDEAKRRLQIRECYQSGFEAANAASAILAGV